MIIVNTDPRLLFVLMMDLKYSETASDLSDLSSDMSFACRMVMSQPVMSALTTRPYAYQQDALLQ